MNLFETLGEIFNPAPQKKSLLTDTLKDEIFDKIMTWDFESDDFERGVANLEFESEKGNLFMFVEAACQLSGTENEPELGYLNGTGYSGGWNLTGLSAEIEVNFYIDGDHEECIKISKTFL